MSMRQNTTTSRTNGPKSPKEIVLPYCPQDYQRTIHSDQTRNKVIVIGRRGGKTEWLAPTYRQVKSICWRRLKRLLHDDDSWKTNEQELSMTHKHLDTVLELKGADNEDSLRGPGLQSAGLDECAMMKMNVWPEIIRPMLADTRGPAAFIGTPKGRNWFYDLYAKGLLDKDSQWKSWHFPTAINKYISAEEIEQARQDMSERLFKQEFLAEFLDDDTGVFKKVRQCIVGELKTPILGRFYVMGVDLAKTEDFTVLTVVDSITREVVAFVRFRGVSWTEQKLRIQELAFTYNNALVIVDSTGVGDPIVEDLEAANISLHYEGDRPGYKFTHESKVRLIEGLAIAIEQRLITWPRTLEVLTQEVMNYEYFISDGGRIKYGAPEGKHDDCVVSLALANWGIRSQSRSAQVVQARIEEPVDRQGQGEAVLSEPDFPKVSGY